MAWTWSTSRRESFANSAVVRLGRRIALDALFPAATSRQNLIALLTVLPGLQAIALVIALGQDLTKPHGIATAATLTAAAAALAVLALAWVNRTTLNEQAPAEDTEAQDSERERADDLSDRHATTTATVQSCDVLTLRAANDHASRNMEADSWAALLHQIHHELRTPLNAVLGFTDLMQREPFGPLGSPRYREYLAHIQQSGELLLKSAEDTLAMTNALATRRQSATTRDRTDVESLARASWNQLPLDPAQIGFTLQVDGGDAEIEGDSTALRQIFANLFCEAIARSDLSGPILCSANVDQDFVRIEVSGHGGMPQGAAATPSLDVCIARTLLELHGAGLVVVARAGESWRAVTVLDHAAQTDFFAATHDRDPVFMVAGRQRAMTG